MFLLGRGLLLMPTLLILHIPNAQSDPERPRWRIGIGAFQPLHNEGGQFRLKRCIGRQFRSIVVEG